MPVKSVCPSFLYVLYLHVFSGGQRSAKTQSDSGSVVYPVRAGLSSGRCSKKPEQLAPTLHPQLPFSTPWLDP